MIEQPNGTVHNFINKVIVKKNNKPKDISVTRN